MPPKLDLTGQRFGKLVAVKDSGKQTKCRITLWLCKCDCGCFSLVRVSNLRGGQTKSCGCKRFEQAVDLTGQRFGKLIVIADSGERYYGNVKWRCRCDCGNFVTVVSQSLKNKQTKSCGCLQRELASVRLSAMALRHGACVNFRATRLYTIWANMLKRCGSPGATGYKWYGGKGICVCDEWRRDFVVFQEWANTHGYDDSLTIHRIESAGDYEPLNCQWITRAENVREALRRRYE